MRAAYNTAQRRIKACSAKQGPPQKGTPTCQRMAEWRRFHLFPYYLRLVIISRHHSKASVTLANVTASSVCRTHALHYYYYYSSLVCCSCCCCCCLICVCCIRGDRGLSAAAAGASVMGLQQQRQQQLQQQHQHIIIIIIITIVCLTWPE